MDNAKKYKYVVFFDVIGTGKALNRKLQVLAVNADAASLQVRELMLNRGQMVDIISVERLLNSGRPRKIRSAVMYPVVISWPE
jgi:hypothetical protein